MDGHLEALRKGITRPLELAYHPLYRFYEGGSLTRQFRGLPDRPDDWWSEDWVGSCTAANNGDPDGKPQGPSSVELPGIGAMPLSHLIEALPEEMVGAQFADNWGPITGVLVKLLSPAGQVPLHAHPTREWAKRHLNSPYGKTEAWILLDALGDGSEPAYAGVGFRPGIDRGWFAEAVRRHDNAAIRGTLHRTEVHTGDVFVAHAGVPHYLGPKNLVHRSPGAERPHRHRRRRRVGRRRRDHGSRLGPSPRHDRLRLYERGGDVCPGAPAA